MIPLVPETIPRAALLAGGSQPLVTAIAQALARSGFAVAIQCHALAAEDFPDGMLALPADLTDEAQTAILVSRATDALGPIGVLINCAGTVHRDTWDDATRATWDMHIETNLRAPFVLIQHFANALPESSEGVVINLLDQRVWSVTPHFVRRDSSPVSLRYAGQERSCRICSEAV